MKPSDLLTRRNIISCSAIVALALAVSGYLLLSRPARVQMARYVPADALAFIEVDSLTDVLDGLTSTRAWRELAPALGISSQLRQIGLATDLMSRTGLGPDEAIIAGRAQLAIAVTGLEAETGGSVARDVAPQAKTSTSAAPEGGLTVHLKPRFALIVETHSKPETASRLVQEHTPILARRIYGENASERREEYLGCLLSVFSGPQPERQMITAWSGSVIVIGNHISAIKSCLDAVAGRTLSLAEDDTLKRRRPAIDHDSSIFAFVTESGVQRLVRFGSAIISTRITTDLERIESIGDLFGHLSDQSISGLLYSSRFEAGGVTERYLTVLREQVALGLAEPMKPGAAGDFSSLEAVPRDVEDVTVISVARAGEMPMRVLKQMAPRVDVVGAIALREFVESFYKQFGVDQVDALGRAIGDEVAVVRFSQSEPIAMLLRVADKESLEPAVMTYLSPSGSTVSVRQYNGTEISVSSFEDGRAAAQVGDYLALGTSAQIERMLDALAAGNGIAKDERLKRALANRLPGASILSYKPADQEAARMMLAISRLTRVSDGSRDLLEQERVRRALERVPPPASFTEFRDYGIYTETRSAVGSFSLIGSLAGEE